MGNFLKLETIKENKTNIKRSNSIDDLDTLRTTFLTNGIILAV